MALALRFGATQTLPGYLLLALSGTILSRIDLKTKLLPNRIVWPAFWIGAASLALASGTAHAWPNFARAALGALILFTTYLVLALISPAGLGMGDVKFAAVLGMYSAYIGWGTLFVTGLLGFLLGAIVALVVAATRRGQPTTTFPFGPSMFSGAILSILGSPKIVPFLFPFLPALH
ncbi:A24 family peptidase [Arthrobacter sp. SDTb3-6]|uniref:prepilin peptidase n=1 Tax=Arthrobacter sp. SDTb3-6 TaxID=2713571 RepID=UPI00159D1133|nr:A24 family peptidase [Arthrobacter sp. SDTb3-6]NVN00071.1 prepilin peptidase [Arthrobacter sp. SDTb3-6]